MCSIRSSRPTPMPRRCSSGCSPTLSSAELVETKRVPTLDLRVAESARSWLTEAEDAGLGEYDHSAVLPRILGPKGSTGLPGELDHIAVRVPALDADVIRLVGFLHDLVCRARHAIKKGAYLRRAASY